MKVYILTESVYYEGTDLIGVYSTFEVAQKYMRSYIGINSDKTLKVSEENEWSIRYGDRTIAIEEQEVIEN